MSCMGLLHCQSVTKSPRPPPLPCVVVVCVQALAFGEVPQLHSLVVRAREDQPGVRREDASTHPVAVALQAGLEPTRGQSPHFEGLVVAACQQHALVGRKAHAAHGSSVASNDGALPLAGVVATIQGELGGVVR